MTISTEELNRMAEGRHVFGHKDGLALAAELLTARAKIEAAEKLAEAAYRVVGRDSHIDATISSSGPERRVVMGDFASLLSPHLAAWSATQ